MAEVADNERFDGMLLNVAQQAGSIDNILDVFFGFLQRKTDFFTGSTDESAAEQMVLKWYKKHWKAGQKRRMVEVEKNRLADEDRKRRVEEKKAKDLAEYEKQQAEKGAAVEVTDEEAATIKADKVAVAAGKDGEKKKDDEANGEAKKDGDKDEEEEESKEPPPEGNGGKTDKYTWTQTLSSLEVFVPVKPGTKAKQVVCDIGGQSLKLGIKGEDLVINGNLFEKVKTDDCMWTLIDNKIVQISMEKFDGMKWWNCVVQGDTSIDTKKIVPENSKLSDLDGETRMTVEKMMYDQRQKALGKPSSDQEKQHDLLEKFKMSHPEMDFSKAKVNYGGGGGGGGFNM